MTTQKPAFMPAPRPASHVSPQDAQKLIEGTADLGFARQGGAAGGKGSIERDGNSSEQVSAHTLTPRKANNPEHERKAEVKNDASDRKTDNQILRLDVPLAVWRSLKLASVDRRVSVRYLVMEALEKAGYDVDLGNVAQDGRRDR